MKLFKKKIPSLLKSKKKASKVSSKKKPKKSIKKAKKTKKPVSKKKTAKKQIKKAKKTKKPVSKKKTAKKPIKKIKKPIRKIQKKAAKKEQAPKPKPRFRLHLKGKTASIVIKEMGVELDDQTAKITDILEQKDDISENELAVKLKIKINAVRRSLYKLHDLGLATYSKQKDEVKKWWYLYSWTLDVEKLYNNYLKFKKDELEKKKLELESEQQFAFQCKKCGKKYSYEEGLEMDFNCEECQKVLIQVANKKLMSQLEQEITELEEEFKKAKGER